MSKKVLAFDVDGLTLVGNLYWPDGPAKSLALLILHGWTGTQNEWGAKEFSKHGYICMTFGLRGHTNSEGDINTAKTSDFFNDTVSAYDVFKKEIGDKKVAVVGNSFGAYLGVLLSEVRDVYCLSLRAPANYKDEDFDFSKMERTGTDNPVVSKWRNNKLTTAQNRALKTLHEFSGPIQIIEAENDQVVPHQTVQNYIHAISDKTKLEYILWKDAPHSIGDSSIEQREILQNEYYKMLLNWLNKIIQE